MKASLGQLSLKLACIGPKIWPDIPENLKSLVHLQNRTKTSGYLAKISFHFVFIWLSLFRNNILVPLFSLRSLISPVGHPTSVHRHAFSPMFLLFCLLISSDVQSIHFVTLLLLHVKRLLLKIDLC